MELKIILVHCKPLKKISTVYLPVNYRCILRYYGPCYMLLETSTTSLRSDWLSNNVRDR